MKSFVPVENSNRLCFGRYGAMIEVRSDHSSLLDAIKDKLPELSLVQSSTSDVAYSIVRSGNGHHSHFDALEFDRRILVNAAPASLITFLASEIRFQIAQHARDAVFVHAGVAGWQGCAIIIPGRSMSGKSSLVEALVRAGAVYYSDEYAAVDADGWVHPYAKPVSMRRPDGTVEQIDLRTRGAQIGKKPLPAGTILVTHYRKGAQWKPKRLTPAQAVLALVDNAVLATIESQRVLETMSRLASRAVALKGVRGEAKPLATQLLRRLAMR